MSSVKSPRTNLPEWRSHALSKLQQARTVLSEAKTAQRTQPIANATPELEHDDPADDSDEEVNQKLQRMAAQQRDLKDRLAKAVNVCPHPSPR